MLRIVPSLKDLFDAYRVAAADAGWLSTLAVNHGLGRIHAFNKDLQGVIPDGDIKRISHENPPKLVRIKYIVGKEAEKIWREATPHIDETEKLAKQFKARTGCDLRLSLESGDPVYQIIHHDAQGIRHRWSPDDLHALPDAWQEYVGQPMRHVPENLPSPDPMSFKCSEIPAPQPPHKPSDLKLRTSDKFKLPQPSCSAPPKPSHTELPPSAKTPSTNQLEESGKLGFLAIAGVGAGVMMMFDGFRRLRGKLGHDGKKDQQALNQQGSSLAATAELVGGLALSGISGYLGLKGGKGAPPKPLSV